MSAVELQIRQLRTEMREQFSAARQEFSIAGSGLRGEIQTLPTELRAEIKPGAAISQEGTRSELRREIRESNEETRRLMRVLHEEKLARLADLQERWWPRRRKR